MAGAAGSAEVAGIVLGASALSVAWRAFGPQRDRGVSLSRDGRRYLALAAGRPAPIPFALRWLLPRLCSTSVTRWGWCTAVHLTVLPALVAWWLTGWVGSPVACVAGGLLVCGLPGVWRIHLRWPVLVDAAAMTWAMASAVSAQHRLWALAAGTALVAGCIKETAPVFAACYGWHPAALVGLVAPLVRAATVRLGDDVEGQTDIFAHPHRASRRMHRGRWLDPSLMVTPWGICLLGLAAGDPRIVQMLAVTGALAYGQVLVATDTVRLYQWAAPAAILATMAVVPSGWGLAALAVHLANPWAGDGL